MQHRHPDASGVPCFGNWRWPGNDGAVPGTVSARALATSDNLTVDRIGGPIGSCFSPRDESFELRALPPDRLNYRRVIFEVDTSHPLVRAGRVTVEESRVAPAFGQVGGGVQYRFFISGALMTQEHLVNLGILSPTP